MKKGKVTVNGSYKLAKEDKPKKAKKAKKPTAKKAKKPAAKKTRKPETKTPTEKKSAKHTTHRYPRLRHIFSYRLSQRSEATRDSQHKAPRPWYTSKIRWTAAHIQHSSHWKQQTTLQRHAASRRPLS